MLLAGKMIISKEKWIRMNIREEIEKILPMVEKPARYIGQEYNSIKKQLKNDHRKQAKHFFRWSFDIIAATKKPARRGLF